MKIKETPEETRAHLLAMLDRLRDEAVHGRINGFAFVASVMDGDGERIDRYGVFNPDVYVLAGMLKLHAMVGQMALAADRDDE